MVIQLRSPQDKIEDLIWDGHLKDFLHNPQGPLMTIEGTIIETIEKKIIDEVEKIKGMKIDIISKEVSLD